jgi:hypothetical protein
MQVIRVLVVLAALYAPIAAGALILAVAEPAASGDIKDDAFNALIAREGMWTKIGDQYVTRTYGQMAVCGAGYHDSQTRKFLFVYTSGRMVLSTDRGGDWQGLWNRFCQPIG